MSHLSKVRANSSALLPSPYFVRSGALRFECPPKIRAKSQRPSQSPFGRLGPSAFSIALQVPTVSSHPLPARSSHWVPRVSPPPGPNPDRFVNRYKRFAPDPNAARPAGPVVAASHEFGTEKNYLSRFACSSTPRLSTALLSTENIRGLPSRSCSFYEHDYGRDIIRCDH